MFDQTTDTDENVYVQDGRLYIKPTLQNETLVTTNNNLSLGASCTGTTFYACNAVTNTTNGTIVPPVKSGRITTRNGPTIKYGRIEVTATLPSGDWLWPAIWLLPLNSTYGPWPASGEIDIAEARGNNYTYPSGGNNIISSALHWGPDTKDDAFWRTNNKLSALHTTFAAKEHTFGMEWSQKYIFTYVDTRLLQVLYNPFTPEGLWARGQFPLSLSNGTTITDPWVAGGFNAPFDQEFYLILNVAVGGTNGWWQDGVAGKPWVDNSLTAEKDFWDARDQWLPTWGDGAQMVVSKVQMWQQLD